MKLKLLLLFVIGVFCYKKGNAQTEPNPKKNRLELFAGFNTGSLVNLEFSPVSRYDYSGLSYNLGYERTSKKGNLFNANFNFLTTRLESQEIPDLNSDYSKQELGFSYLKKVYEKNRIKVHAGLKSYTGLSQYTDTNYWLAEQKITLAGQVTYKINERHQIRGQLEVPAILLLASTSNFGIYSFKKYQSLGLNLDYNYQLSNSFDFNLGANFNYDRIQITSALREVQYQMHLGIQYKF